MARSSGNRKNKRADTISGYHSDAADIARYGVTGATEGVAAPGQEEGGAHLAPGQGDSSSPIVGGRRRRGKGPEEEIDASTSPWSASPKAISIGETDRLAAKDRASMRTKCIVSTVILVVAVIFALGLTGATVEWGPEYHVYTPLEVFAAIGENIYNLLAKLEFVDAHNIDYLNEWPLVHDIMNRIGVIAITLVCAALLALSGMLYQNVFRNPIAGPGILGVSSGVSLANALMVLIFGAEAATMIVPRYAMSYIFGALIIIVVMIAGFKMTGKGKPLDVVNMMLVGSVLSQMVGFIVTFITSYLVDEDVYDDYVSLSEMLTVDTSLFSYICLGIVVAVTLVPVWMMRFKLNALSFEEQEVRLMGIDLTPLRTVALIAGGLMMLAAQVHIGAVSMVAIIVPFLSRSIFGCEFRKQLVGNVFIAMILLTVCRCVVDLIPFVGDGLGIGSAVSLFALPLFLLIVAFHMRGWE